MKILHKEIKLEQVIRLPFNNIENAIKGIVNIQCVDETNNKVYITMLDEFDGTLNRQFVIHCLTENEVAKKLKVSDFLGTCKTGTGKLYLFITEKDIVDNIDLTKRKFYNDIINKERNLLSKESENGTNFRKM